ncbi:uncharacterized protein LACBIDRAFT_330818 [Laccaria bicolor S238N-H82]|uniref:Predicted protein n=1 Tax=Laccaria bicolor (strain S238N-H82 / ATCC MYA-4686) TaxID=486041 RepID=B0DMK5_LACBS|nr:uncharacterized protein LACBIDRAFT_330818 [Laccaria bicolor S238N-H82]EDR04305.1 predicted protein [Laccaria bicolor S238N-H82]|eukprot:XP_001885196.1 predicted protein [Laccaria bicolor S238N-H82]
MHFWNKVIGCNRGEGKIVVSPHMKLPCHLLMENVPVYYFWQEDTDDQPCFVRLSPTILKAYHDTCDSLNKTEVFGNEMVGFQDDITTIKQYNEFFQLKHTPNSRLSLSFSDIPPDAVVYICDFEGWSTRLIMDASLIGDYLARYHSCIKTDENTSYVTIWHWKPCHSLTRGTQCAGQWGAGFSQEARRGDWEICELFKAVHAPIGKAHFDECGRITLVSRLGDVYEGKTGSPMDTESQHNQQVLPRPSWVPATHPQLAVPVPTSPLNMASRWVQSMIAPLSLPRSRASSAACHSRSSGDHDFHRCSASPEHSQAEPKDQLPEWRASYIKELCTLGGQYANDAAIWASKKPLSWNLDYLDIGYLLLPDLRVQAHLCYWAACLQDASTLARILFKAVTHGIPFGIGVGEVLSDTESM